MPGIFGIVEKSGEAAGGAGTPFRGVLAAMAAEMQYEPFYTSRLYASADLGVYAGWVGRIDQAPSQGPIVSPERAVSLFLAGEPYGEAMPDGELEQRCRRDGREGFRIVSHYERSGDEFPARMHGLFAGLLIDERQGKSLLFNDRFGVERLFVYEDDRKLIFSSEAKAILAVVPETRSLDPDGVAEFLACGCSFGETSLFRNIRVLPPGTIITCARGKVPRARQYFDRAAWERVEPMTEWDFVARFGEALENVIERQASQPPQVAVSLTGGLDSRMIMAGLVATNSSVRCYTFGSMYRDTYDVRVARRVAERCGQPHTVLRLGEDFLRGIGQHLEKAVFVSDGYLGLSGAAELYLNSLARLVAPIRITGNYGGELLRGFRAFKASMPEGDFLRPELAAGVNRATAAFSRLDEMPPLSFTLFRQAPSGYGRYAIERSQVSVRSPFLDDRLAALFYRNPGRFTGGPEPSVALIERWHRDLLAIPTDRGLLGRGGSLTKRVRRLYREGLFKAEYSTGHGAPHWVSKLTRSRPGAWVAGMFQGRHKFQHPRVWIRKHLDAYARETLLADGGGSLAAFFDRGRVEAMLQAHLRGERNYCEELDKLLTLALTERHLLHSR